MQRHLSGVLNLSDCKAGGRVESDAKQEIHVLFVRLQAITEIDAAPNQPEILKTPTAEMPFLYQNATGTHGTSVG